MDQIADETALRCYVEDKERVNKDKESALCLRRETIPSESQVCDWRACTSAETDLRDTSRGTDVNQPRENLSSSSSSLFSLKMHQSGYSSAASCATDNPSSSQESHKRVDCVDIVLCCLFCRFFDMIHMLPDSCERLTNHCYRHVIAAVQESTSSDDEDSCLDLDCGLFHSCNDATDCLELAMEISEICYH